MIKKELTRTEYRIRKWDDSNWWMIDQAETLSYDINLTPGLEGGGIQHNLPDDKGHELQLCCEAVIAAMINLHKFIEENTIKEEEDANCTRDF